jgi:hypothetical protein
LRNRILRWYSEEKEKFANKKSAERIYSPTEQNFKSIATKKNRPKKIPQKNLPKTPQVKKDLKAAPKASAVGKKKKGSSAMKASGKKGGKKAASGKKTSSNKKTDLKAAGKAGRLELINWYGLLLSDRRFQCPEPSDSIFVGAWASHSTSVFHSLI